MRPRTETLVALAAFALLAVLALQSGRSRQGAIESDLRASSYLYGPSGLAGLAEVVERRGGTVTRWRGRSRDLTYTSDAPATLIVAEPSTNISLDDTHTLLQWPDSGGNLIVAGMRAWLPMECLGYFTEFSVLDSMLVRAPNGQTGGWVHAVLQVADTGRIQSDECPEVQVTGTDTLLTTTDSGVVAVRLTLGGERSGQVILMSDAAPLTNQGLRYSGVPEVLVPLVMEQDGRVVFDEYHQGFGPSGSMAGAALAWTATSPWGWMIWQLAIVGLIAWMAGAVRFGPLQRVFSRERRSSREHVEALANAFAASRGHDVAIGLLVNGLRRRLLTRHSALITQSVRTDWRAWVAKLQQTTHSPDLQREVSALATFSDAGQTDVAVLQAANRVEDVWEKLTLKTQ